MRLKNAKVFKLKIRKNTIAAELICESLRNGKKIDNRFILYGMRNIGCYPHVTLKPLIADTVSKHPPYRYVFKSLSKFEHKNRTLPDCDIGCDLDTHVITLSFKMTDRTKLKRQIKRLSGFFRLAPVVDENNFYLNKECLTMSWDSFTKQQIPEVRCEI